jgi:hypothetical protein
MAALIAESTAHPSYQSYCGRVKSFQPLSIGK